MKIRGARCPIVRGAVVSGATGLLLLLLARPAVPADWRVSPIRLDLGADARTGIIKVINEKDVKFLVQVKAMEWSQDPEGKDQYRDTGDIVFFPRIIPFEKDEERTIRAGIKGPVAGTEKSYRLFVEELPEPRTSTGANVAVALRVGIPIFVRPSKEAPAGDIGKIGMSKGVVEARVRNTGNVHFVIRSVAIKGKARGGEELFAKELAGWYLLPGASRAYTAPVPRDICDNVAVYQVEVTTDRVALSGRWDADTATCAP